MKKLLAICLTLVLILGMMPIFSVSAASSATFSAGSATGAPGEEITVPVSIDTNPGLTAVQILVGYDADVLEVVKIETLTLSGLPASCSPTTLNPLRITWANCLEDTTATGDIANVTFKIKDDVAAGTYPLTVSAEQDNVYDIAFNDVPFMCVNGSVTVEGNSVVEPPVDDEPTLDPTKATFSIGSITGAPGEEVTVPVSVATNPGLAFAQVLIGYDADVLEVVNIETLTLSGIPASRGPTTLNPLRVSWGSPVLDSTATGDIANVTFKIKDDVAAGTYPLTASADQDNVYDTAFNDVPFTCISGSVTVEVETIDPSVENSATITFDADKANRTSYSTEQQIWEQNGIKVTNNKASSTTTVNDYANPARFYKGSEVIVEYPGMTMLVIDHTGLISKYVVWDTSFTDANATAVVDTDTTTITFATPVDSFTFASLSAQCRAYSMTVYTNDACLHSDCTYESNGDETHKIICNDCSETVNAAAECVDNEKDGVCDNCTGDVAVSFDPTGKTPAEIVDAAYALASGESFEVSATLTGVITAVNTPYSDQYSNVTVTIAIEGKEDKPIECYRLKGDSADTITIDDTITVTGILTNYNGKIEFAQGCTLDAVVKGDFEVVVPEDPKEIVDAAFALEAGTSLLYEATLQGEVVSIDTEYSETYGNVTLTISVEGTDGMHDLLCYRLKAGEGADASTVKVGDVIAVTGTIKNYNGTVEFDSGCTFVVVVKGECDSHTAVQVVDDKYLATEATCEDKATYYTSCSVCGEKLDATFSAGELADHKYGAWITTKEPTATEAGIKEKECLVCGDVVTETIPALNVATFSIGSVTGAPGEEVTVPVSILTNPGLTYAQVKVGYFAEAFEVVKIETLVLAGTPTSCGPTTLNPLRITWANSLEDTIETGEIALVTFKIKDDAATGTYVITASAEQENVYDTAFNDVPFTCVNGLITVAQCSHSWGNNVSDQYLATVATCINAATYYPVCNKCGEVNFDATFAAGGVDNDNHIGTITTHPAVESTCTVAGNNEYVTCDDCGAVIVGSDAKLPLTEHNWANVVDDRYLATGAKYYKSCLVCGEVNTGATFEVAKFTLGEVAGTVGDLVTVPVRITNNPGLTFTQLMIGYDTSALEVVSIETLTFAGKPTSSSPINKNPLKVTWANGLADTTETGDIANITFRIKDTATTGKYTLALSAEQENVYDTAFNDVPFVCEDGYVSVCVHNWIKNVDDKYRISDCIYYESCEFCGKIGTETFETAKFVAGDVIGAPGDKVTVPVSIVNNPGLTFAQIMIGYDASVLEVVSIETLTFAGKPTSCSPITVNPLKITFSDCLANTTETGYVANITFRIKDTASAGRYALAVTALQSNVFDTEYNDVPFVCENGEVRVCVHEWVDLVDDKYLATEATCAEKATYYRSCAICGERGEETFSSGEVNADNHGSWGEKVHAAVESTCTVAGNEEYVTCNGCGAVVEGSDAKLPLLPHTYDTEYDYTCNVCQFSRAPHAPTLAYKYSGTVVLNAVDGLEYSYNGIDWQSSPIFVNLVENTKYNFVQRVKASSNAQQSESSKSLNITLKLSQSTPDAPIVTSFSDTTITLSPTANGEYSLDGINWQSSNVFKNLKPVTEYSIYQRYAETETHEMSYISAYLIIKTDKSKQTAIPSAPVVDSYTASSITLVLVDGCEYSLDGINWQSSNVFNDLSCATQYTFYQRYKETDTTYAGRSSERLMAKTDKGTQTAPSAPTLLNVTAKTITLVAIEGYEYSRDGINWQSSNVFVNLEADTNYLFYQRIAETDKYYASARSESLIAKTNDVLKGDSNGDGLVNGRDYGMLMQYLNDWDVTIDLEAADVNGDGLVNGRDYGMLMQYLNDWDVEFK